MRMRGSSKLFRAEWAEAKRNFHKKEIKHSMHVRAGESCGMRMSMFFWFIRTCEWNRLFNHTPGKLGFKEETLRDETNCQTLTGVLVRPTDGEPLHKYRVIEMWSEDVRFVEEEVMGPENQLRIREPKETFRALNGIVAKKRCPDS